ncbi:MAG: DUF2797 domain-containing protein [Candidatus Heimdallarchaeaceae archaeon]
MMEHLTAVKWNPSTFPFAFLLLRKPDDNSNEVIKKSLSPGDSFNVTVSEEKRCIGHSINKEEYYFCNNSVTEQYNRCYTCEQQDFQRCFLFCDASKPFGNCANSAAYEYCKTHKSSVYLALIANNVKVGVSFNPLKRWMNQGADVAIEILRVKNGFEARTIEKKISSDLGISQAIRKATKAKKLNYDLTRSLPDFRKLTKDVLSYLEKQSLVSEPSDLLHKETSLSSYYGDIPSLDVNPILNEVEKTLQITGIIVGVKGKLLVTKVNNSYYVTNLSKISGHLMTFSEKSLKLKGQKSLSEFF